VRVQRGAHAQRAGPQDLRDCQWIAELHEHGLLRPRFIPAAEVGALRQRTRCRRKLIESTTSEQQRLARLLEDGGAWCRARQTTSPLPGPDPFLHPDLDLVPDQEPLHLLPRVRIKGIGRSGQSGDEHQAVAGF
jgi:hypothetical protein